MEPSPGEIMVNGVNLTWILVGFGLGVIMYMDALSHLASRLNNARSTGSMFDNHLVNFLLVLAMAALLVCGPLIVIDGFCWLDSHLSANVFLNLLRSTATVLMVIFITVNYIPVVKRWKKTITLPNDNQ